MIDALAFAGIVLAKLFIATFFIVCIVIWILTPRDRCRYPKCDCPFAWLGKGKPPETVCMREFCK